MKDSIDYQFDAKKSRLTAKVKDVKDGVLVIKK